MKKLIISVVIAFIGIGFASTHVNAQVILEGKQTANHGSNAKLDCTPVVIKSNVKIIKVEGYNAGFWIEKEGQAGAIVRYWNTNDPKAVGYVLKPGKYWVFPNLQQGKNTAHVKLTLK